MLNGNASGTNTSGTKRWFVNGLMLQTKRGLPAWKSTLDTYLESAWRRTLSYLWDIRSANLRGASSSKETASQIRTGRQPSFRTLGHVRLRWKRRKPRTVMALPPVMTSKSRTLNKRTFRLSSPALRAGFASPLKRDRRHGQNSASLSSCCGKLCTDILTAGRSGSNIVTST